MENQKPLIVALSVLAVVVVLGGLGLYAVQIKQSNDLRQEMSSAINQVSTQITELKTLAVVQTDDQLATQVSAQLSSADASATIASPSPSPTSDSSNNNISYSNSNYGFSLQLPPAWKGYTTKTEIKSNGTFVYFGFSSWTSIFGVGVYTKEQWNKIKSNPDDVFSQRSYIGENNKYVFTSSRAQDYGDPQYNSLVNDFDRIMATFKTFTK